MLFAGALAKSRVFHLTCEAKRTTRTLTRLDMSPGELRARALARAWDALAGNAALRHEVESLRREIACVTPSPRRPTDSESDLD